jgi:hypothetical protein
VNWKSCATPNDAHRRRSVPQARDIDDLWHAVHTLRGLAKVGNAEDRQKLVRLFADPMPAIQAAAARTYLALSPNTVTGAKDLLAEPSEYLVWVVVRHALQAEESLWSLLKPFLAHENENIRRLVCYYAVRVLKKAALKKLLDEYLSRGRYFYNAVTLLDRALYSPKKMREMYVRDDEEFFERWTTGATWRWQ